MPSDDVLIERCALIAEDAVAELTGILNSAAGRKAQYDRQTKRKLRYAVRWCRRIADHIRAINPKEDIQYHAGQNSPRLIAALNALRELKPVVEGARNTHWSELMTQRIDAILREQNVEESDD